VSRATRSSSNLNTSDRENAVNPTADTALLFRETFENHPITFVNFRGEPVVVARELGAALGYADPSKIGEKIRGDWSADFIEGTDYRLLDGADLAAFKAEWSDTPESGVSTLDRTRRALLVLTESGWWMVAQKTEKALGVKLRRFLATEVLPKLGRGEAVGAPKNDAGLLPISKSREIRLYSAAMKRAGRSNAEIADYQRREEAAHGFVLLAAKPEPTQIALPLTAKSDDWPAFLDLWARTFGTRTLVEVAHLVPLTVGLIDLGDDRSELGKASKLGRMLAKINKPIGRYELRRRHSTKDGYELRVV